MLTPLFSLTPEEMTSRDHMRDFKVRLRQAFEKVRLGYRKYPWIYL